MVAPSPRRSKQWALALSTREGREGRPADTMSAPWTANGGSKMGSIDRIGMWIVGALIAGAAVLAVIAYTNESAKVPQVSDNPPATTTK